MKTFEQNLDVLVKSLEEESQGFDKKFERLIREMQIEFQEGATCPLAQPHKDFIRILRVNNDIPDSFRAWAEGVYAYEIALQLPSSKKMDAIAPRSIAQPAAGLDTDSAKNNEITAPPDKPKIPVKTDANDWNSDL